MHNGKTVLPHLVTQQLYCQNLEWRSHDPGTASTKSSAPSSKSLATSHMSYDADVELSNNGQSSSSDASSTGSSVCKDKDEEDTNLESDSSGSESVAPPVPKKKKVAGRQKRKGNSILEFWKEHSERQINETRRHKQFLQQDKTFDRLLDILQNKKP
ncbi:hypothetical protein CHS0354_007267 [Potamilus streckersoni]|uniref:Uncharacterized protein n=1 Tax=Potamilus streckersoni TaxID=2493646 RepID=A0AAE0TEI1_9BIVA|nr:hypothetical protein CHS0354_007267 [Potamilus streckersoni]